MAGSFPPLSFQKGGQRRRRCFFIKGVGAGTFWGCDFLPACRQTCPKSYLCNFYLQFFPTKIKTFFWCDLQKSSSCVFLQTLGSIFLSQATFGAIFTRIFRNFAQIFSKLKLLGVLFHPHLQHHCFS